MDLNMKNMKIYRIGKICKTKSTIPAKSNLPTQTYQTKLTKPNLPNQTYQTKPTKPNLPNQI